MKNAYLLGVNIINRQSKIRAACKVAVAAAAVAATTSNVANTPVNNSEFIPPSVAASDARGNELALFPTAMSTFLVTAVASATCLKQWGPQPSSDEPPPEAHHDDMSTENGSLSGSVITDDDDCGGEAQANIVSDIPKDIAGEDVVIAGDILTTIKNRVAETAVSDAGGIESALFPTAMETVEETTVSNTWGNESIKGPTTTAIGDGGGKDGKEEEPTTMMTKPIPPSPTDGPTNKSTESAVNVADDVLDDDKVGVVPPPVVADQAKRGSPRQ